ncbi:hypothetical protein [Promicromonospora soli]
MLFVIASDLDHRVRGRGGVPAISVMSDDSPATSASMPHRDASGATGG